jgi:hypothetical protein
LKAGIGVICSRPFPRCLVRAKRITDAWTEQKIIREIMVFLHSNGVGTARAVRIYKTWCRRRAGHDGKPVPPGARHSWHWLQDRRRYRYEAWRRENRHDPGARPASRMH